MSTDINIKKKISIKEENVLITSDVNSINFTGSGVIASSTNNDVTVNITGGSGTTTYYLNQTVNQTPYKEFSSIPTSAAEQTIVTSVASGTTATIQSFQTATGVPGTTNIPGGLWSFYLHFSGTLSDTWDIFTEVYKRNLAGVETLLLTTDQLSTSSLTGSPTMILTDGVFPASTVLTTDRIVVKVKVTNTDSTTNSITFYTEGSTNYSVGLTTLNQTIPTGAVTNVTGTPPIASSGGTAPAISISQATALVDGYLDSADFALFNGKQDPITLTTLTSSGAATFIANVLNIPNYTLSGLGGVPTSRNITINGNTQDLSADRTYTVTDANLSTSDITTNDVSITKHGFVPKAPNDLAKYLRGDGTWAIIPSVSLGKILFVATTGNDGTAIIGSISNPYLTLEAAQAASTNGDLIYVYPGTYTVTTTATEGLAKDGVSYYFSPGCTINKSTAGDMFRVSSFTTGFSVYGYGNFNKTTNAASILYVTSSSFNIVFQANELTTSTSSVIFDIRSATKCYLDFKNASSTAGAVINIDSSRISIEMHSMSSTAGVVFAGSAGGAAGHFSNCNLNVNGYLIETTAINTHCIAMSTNNIININVNYIKSATLTFGLSYNGLDSMATLTTSYITGINASYVAASGKINLNGYCYSLAGRMFLDGGQVGRINIINGEVNTNYAGTQDNSTSALITVSGGKVTLLMQNQDPTSGFAISGGIVTLNGNWTNDDMSAASDLTGGTLIINGDYEYGGASYAQTRYYGIRVNGGTLFLNGTIRVNFPASLGLTSYTSLFASPIEFNSGKVIINGGTLISNISNVTPIRTTAAGLALKVYSGGMNTNLISNGGTLAAKKLKMKWDVTAVASTSITLNDGTGGNETFTESNTAVYNTTALLAQRMVTLINASATLDITASQDIPGTDTYFYTEMDTAGLVFTIPATTNLNGTGLCPAMYTLSQSVLGTIIEDVDIE
jgi:hypothetical protein